MSLPLFNKRQIELTVFVLIFSALLLAFAFTHQIGVVAGLELDLVVITGHCTVTSNTCVGT
ncbi:MAG: hypothetical protein R6X32_20275 [Chloroflexota bacterium]|jgi:hypothetical protein